MNWGSFFRSDKKLFPNSIDSAELQLQDFEKFDENLTPNLRALRLTMTVGETLLSMGVPASSVTSKLLDITKTYCSRLVHVDISSNLLMLSQVRGVDREPLTLIRPVVERYSNNMTIRSIERLVYEIKENYHSIDSAEEALDNILNTPRTYPWWLIMIGNASIVAGVSLMFTNSWRVVMVTFVIGALTDRLLALLNRYSLAAFFRQIIAATFITLSAAIIALMARNGVEFFYGMNPTLIVVGGIVLLVAGLTIVGAIQDAIDEYYVTANARLLKVTMLTTGIVIGILVGLYTARKLGFGIAVSPDPLRANFLEFQVVGAAIVAAGYALAAQTYWRAIIWAGIIGALAVVISYSVRQYDISVIAASGVAAGFVGLIAALLSRFWRTPSSGIINAGIVPLVPGLALYNGLMQLINYPPGDALFARGLGTLFTALAVALAIAAGASFGRMIGRPINQKISHTNNSWMFFTTLRHRPSSTPNPISIAIRDTLAKKVRSSSNKK